MRRSTGLVPLCLGFGLAGPLAAQQSAAPSFFTGVDPHTITFKQVDTTKFGSQFNSATAMRTPTQPKASTLTNFFHSLSLPSWPPKLGSSVFPANFMKQQQAAFPHLTTADLPTMQVQPNQAMLPQ